MTCNDKFPANGGQIIQEYARSKGINTIKFKSKVYKNQRAYFRRVRRAKKVVIVSRTKISLPTPRQSSHLKKDIKVKIASGDLYLGEEIAPKDIISTTITDGKLQQKTTVIHGRKFPLVRLRRIALQEQVSSGVLRYFSDQEYDSLTMDQLTSRYIRIGQKPPAGTLSDKIEHLKLTERTRKIKLWHDHSCILNHSYVCFTISWLYDPANYFTDIEYQEKYKDRKPINVQGIVEKPKLYIFGQSGSSDVEQSSYTAVRIEDLQILSEPITADNGNIKIFDVMRVFSGDGPARQFEIGQQRGGNYPCVCGVHANAHGNFVLCYGISPLTLDERVGLIKSTRCFEELKKGNLNPFQNLKKDDLIEELESRDIDIHNMLRPELQENLSTLLHGICRPPALMTTNPTLSTHHLNLNNYEIFGMEPLHDLSNFIQNIITELPSHISDKKLQKELEEFSKHTIGDKNQIKGSDARLYLVKLSHFLASSQQTDPSIRQMIDSLLEITNISYSKYNTRSPKQILRLYNQSFLLAINCRNVVGVPSKMTSRKFFGSHFHSVSIHLAEVQRIFNLRSLVTEQEERCFGDLRRISENTSNRQPKTVCDNAVLRFTCQQSSKQDSIYIQESIIQKLAKQIQAKPRTIIPSTILKRPILLQSHLERISDYILPGEGVWWHMEDGNMIFHDGPDDEPFHIEGPDMHHFRSSSYKEEHQQLKDIWEKVIENYKRNIITLPLQRIKTFDKDGKVVYITPTETDLPSESTDNYQHNIPVQEFQGSSGTKEPANEDQPSTSPEKNLEQDPDQIPDIENELETREERERKLLENNNIKHLYKSHIKVLKWTIQPSNITVHESVTTQRNILPVNRKPSTCKRKLFESEISNTETAPRRKKTTFDLVVQLLGPSSDVDDCIKYRELKLKHPGHKSFVSAFDQSFSKLQIEVSKRYFALKDKTAKDEGKENRENLLADKEIAQKLLDHWGVYYF